jgi:hypothetical protein
MVQPSTAPRWKMIHSVPTAGRSRSRSRGGSSSARWVRKVQTSSASIEIARRGLR